MRGRIFISYRRDDARGDARAIRDRLARKFGETNVFMDVDSLLAGQRFDHQLDKALAHCDVLIAVIGPRWMEGLAEKQKSDERDYVRAEIAAALKRDIVVIPVLVGEEGRMPALPRAADLPEDIRDLVLYQKHSVTHESFGRNIDDLIAAINAVQQSRRKPFPWRPLAGAGAVAAIALVAALVVFRGEIGGWIDSFRSADVPAAPVVHPKQAAPGGKKAELSPADIAERYTKSTVVIRFVWRLYERDSGRPLYQRSVGHTVDGKTVRLPVYVRVADKVVPWLTTDDEGQRNFPVRGAGGGTGFVANAQGFILTTRTIGASWEDGIRPGDYVEGDNAFLVGKENGKVEGRVVSISELKLPRWEPEAEGATIFSPRLAGTEGNFDLPAGTRSAVVGRNDTLVVRFPNSTVDVNAELVRRSPDQNVALLKVATPELTPALLAADDEVKIGARVVALGYVAGSTGSPTLADGIVRSAAVDDPDRLRGNIQTSIQVGYGTSGAPVFDPEGRVIGMISFFVRDGAQLATYALPIRHGRNLLQPQVAR